MKKMCSRFFRVFMLFAILFIAGSTVNVSAASLNKKSATVYVGKTVQLKLSGASGSVKWKSSNKKVATVTKGKVTGKKAGKATISATANGVTYKCKVTVKNIALNSKKVTIGLKCTYKLKLNGSSIKSATSSNKKIATVTKAGKITGVKAGTAKITVKGANKKSYTCSVTVKNPKLKETSIKLKKGFSKKLTISYAAKTTWSSSNKKVAKVDSKGKVTAVGTGSAVITAKVAGKTFKCKVTVPKPALDLTVSDTNVVIGGYSKYVYFHLESDSVLDNAYLYSSESGTKYPMYDDGKYSFSGDDINDDNIYSCKIDANDLGKGIYNYYAKGDSVSTDKVPLNVFNELTNNELSQMDEVNQDLFDVVDSSDFDNAELSTKKTLVSSRLDILKQNGLISSFAYNSFAKMYEFVYSSGILGGVILNDYNPQFNANNAISLSAGITTEEVTYLTGDETEDSEEETVFLGGESSVEAIEEATEAPEETSEAAIAATSKERAEDDVRPLSRSGRLQSLIESCNGKFLANETQNLGTAKIYYAFNDDWRRDFYQTLRTDWNSKGLSTSIFEGFTIPDLLNIGQDEVSIFSMHGSTFRGTPALCTMDSVSRDKTSSYQKYLLSTQVVEVTTPDGQYYWVRPNFFKENLDKNELSNTFVVSETCEFAGSGSTNDYAMADALTGRGAKAVVGFHNSVLATYSRNVMKRYVDRLIAGDKASAALSSAKSAYGNNDGQSSDAAYPVLRGNGDARLIETSFKNGSFEKASTPKDWATVGDVRVISKLASLTPTDGNRMAILTTGLGSQENKYLSGTEGSILSQKFIVPKDAKTLSFEYDVVSEEPMEWIDSSYDDKFYARILDSQGNIDKEIVSETINSSTWYSISGIDFDGGDSTCYHTKWKKKSVDISKYRGKAITLQFVTFDVGDSNYDTAALVDAVTVK